MSLPKTQTAFRLDAEIIEGLRLIKQRDGIPLSEQVRRALTAWLREKGIKPADKVVRAERRK